MYYLPLFLKRFFLKIFRRQKKPLPLLQETKAKTSAVPLFLSHTRPLTHHLTMGNRITAVDRSDLLKLRLFQLECSEVIFTATSSLSCTNRQLSADSITATLPRQSEIFLNWTHNNAVERDCQLFFLKMDVDVFYPVCGFWKNAFKIRKNMII